MSTCYYIIRVNKGGRRKEEGGRRKEEGLSFGCIIYTMYGKAVILIYRRIYSIDMTIV